VSREPMGVIVNQGAIGKDPWPVEVKNVDNPPSPAAGRSVKGNLTGLNQSLVINSDGCSCVGIQVSGTFVATWQVQCSYDGGTTWNTIRFISLIGVPLQSQTISQAVYAQTFGAPQVRVALTAYTSGIVSVAMTADVGYTSFLDGLAALLADVNISTLVLPRIANWNYVTVGRTLYSLQRSPGTFKTVTATAAGSTALWTPTSGFSFRLMRYIVMLTGDAKQSVAGNITISLLDAAGDIAQDYTVFVPAASLDTMGLIFSSGWIDLGNGITSASTNNVLNVNLSAALTTGLCRVIACGTEE
jgi:hypothetical protein